MQAPYQKDSLGQGSGADRWLSCGLLKDMGGLGQDGSGTNSLGPNPICRARHCTLTYVFLTPSTTCCPLFLFLFALFFNYPLFLTTSLCFCSLFLLLPQSPMFLTRPKLLVLFWHNISPVHLCRCRESAKSAIPDAFIKTNSAVEQSRTVVLCCLPLQ